jgi:hypothetical protein
LAACPDNCKTEAGCPEYTEKDIYVRPITASIATVSVPSSTTAISLSSTNVYSSSTSTEKKSNSSKEIIEKKYFKSITNDLRIHRLQFGKQTRA